MTQQKINNIFASLKNKRLYLQDEKILQEQIAKIFHLAFADNCRREFRLDEKNIPDFLLFNEIAVEVKIKGSKRLIYKQCERYCMFDQVKALVLITNRNMGFPPTINGKDCYFLKLGTAWL